MKIKKNLVAATAAVLAAGMALAGCGSSNGGSGDVQKTADGKVKITMWHGFSEADGKTLESIVDDFNKSHDKYEIDAQLQPWSTIGETMVTKVTTGDGPDFVTTGADNGQGWSIDGTFQCVSDFYADKNNGTGDYLDNVVKQITFNIDGEEEKCAVPMGYAPTSVWYNTDMWKAAGLTAKDIPTTWDQLLEVAKKLTKSDGSQYGLAMADSGWAAYMKGNGTGLYTTDGKVSINSKENKAFLQKMRDFYNGGYAVPGLDDTAARESFESGQSAMVIVGPWEDQAATDKGITHATFAEFRSGNADYAGKRIPYAPRHTAAAVAEYTVSVGRSWLDGIVLSVDGRGVGPIEWNEANSLRQKFYALAGCAIRFEQRHGSLSLWCRNLTQTRYDVFYFESIGNAFLQRGRPREWGVTLTINLQHNER